MSELLIVVAIVIILLAVAIVAIIAHQRNLRQTELDRKAEIIYHAAQNQLTKLKAAGNLSFYDESAGCTSCEERVVSAGGSEIKNPENIYFITSEMKDTRAAQTVLPRGAVDDEVWSRYWVIEYDVQTANVFAVFCSTDEEWYQANKYSVAKLTEDEYNGYRIKRNRLRKTNAKVGYYEGGIVEKPEEGPLEPTINIKNAEELKIEIGCACNGKPISQMKFVVTITGGDGGSISVDVPVSESDITKINDTFYAELTLDSLKDGGRFYDVIADLKDGATAETLCSGKNLTITVEASASGCKPGTATRDFNPLFADVTSGTATISYGRHLQNLDESSHVSSYVTGAIQDKDISFALPEEEDVIDENQHWALVYDDLEFVPIVNNNITGFKALNYTDSEGIERGYVIDALTASARADVKAAGLFGETEAALVIENVSLVNTTLAGNAQTSAGALIGKVDAGSKTVKIVGSRVYLTDYTDVSRITGKTVGGMVGEVVSGTLQITDTANNVAEGSNGNLAATILEGDTAGGLVGAVDAGATTLINKSYADCYLEGSNIGGLIGTSEGTATLTSSYATGFAIAEEGGVAAGLAGGVVSATDCYSAMAYDYSQEATLTENKGAILTTAAAGSTMSNVFYIGEDLKGSPVTNAANTTAKTPVQLKSMEAIGDSIAKRDLETAQDNTFPYNVKGQELTTYSYPEIIGLAHFGDWKASFNANSLNSGIVNGDKLEYKIDLTGMDDNDRTLGFAVAGQTSKKTRIFEITLSEDKTQITEIRSGMVTDTSVAWDEVPVVPDMSITDGILTATLDSVTDEGMHFAELFEQLTPGENITVSAMSGAVEDPALFAEDDVEKHTDNSLFARAPQGTEADDISTAYIGFTRQLQNLDQTVSGVDAAVTSAVMQNSITWDAAKYPRIYANGGTDGNGAYIDNSFYGIHNPNLASLDGQNKTLSDFVIDSAPAAMSSTGAGNAGLFRQISATMAVDDLKLEDFSVNASGNAGTLAAAITDGKTTLTGVLAASSEKSSTAAPLTTVKASLNAGGLVGVSTGEVEINKSAASVRVNGTSNAGGLVGSAANVKIAQSFAGGHTENAEYKTDKAADFNVVSTSGNAGGLVGATNAVATIENSFSAASVSGNNSAGGILGSGTAHMNTVYTVAPVHKADMGFTNYGAVIGKNTSSTASQVYYLPELYEGDEIGITGNAALDSKIADAHYVKGSNNPIAATNTDESGNENLMQSRTYPYDASLKREELESKQREYPFSIWTEFEFDNDGGLKTYYGDWQPIFEGETITHTITFGYVDPSKSGSEALVYMSGDLGVQEFNEGENLEILMPKMENLSDIIKGNPDVVKEYMFANTIGLFNAAGEELCEYSADDISDGFMSVPAEYATGDLFAIGVYEEDATKYAKFFYDSTGANTDFEQIGNAYKITEETKYSDLAKIIPSRNIEGYRLAAWYKDSAFTEPVDFESDELIGTDANFFAKYEKVDYYNITIDFMYSIAGEETLASAEYINSVPRYRTDGHGQYSIRVEAGQSFTDTVTLPVIAEFDGQQGVTKKLTYFDKQTSATPQSDGVATMNASAGTVKFSLNAVSQNYNLVVLYTIPAAKKPNNTYAYRIIYKFNDTNANSTSTNYISNYKAGEAYILDRFGKNFYAPDGENPDFMFEKLTGFELITTEAAPVKATTQDKSKYGSAVEYIVTVEYDRATCFLIYNSQGGSYVPSVEGLYGAAVSAYEANETQILTCTKELHTHTAVPTAKAKDNKTIGCYTSIVSGNTYSWVLSCGKEEHKSHSESCYTTNSAYDPAPVKYGYTFAGWYLDENCTQPINTTDHEVTLLGNVTVYAKWTAANASYRIAYFKQNVDKTTYSYIKSSAAMTAQIGTTVSGNNGAGTFTNSEYYHYNAAKTTSAAVKADGSTVVCAYYDLNTYYFEFDLNNTNTGTNTTMTIGDRTYTKTGDKYTIEVVLGEDISAKWPAADNFDNVKTNYKFHAWHYSGGTNYASKRFDATSELIQNKNNGDTTTYYVDWQSGWITVKLHYLLQATEGNEYIENTDFGQTALTESGFSAKGITGYTNVKSENTTISGTKNFYFYYDRNTYDITYYFGSEQLSTKNAVRFGKNINSSEYNYTPSLPALLEDPNATFGGWYDNPDCSGSPYEFKTMPASDMALYAKWIPSQKTITLHDNYEGGGVDYLVVDFNKSLESLPDATREGFVFKGWYTAATGGTIYSQGAAITENFDLYARWEKDTGGSGLEQRNITVKCVKDSDGGLLYSFETGGTVGETLVIGAPEIDGYYAKNTLTYYVIVEEESQTVELRYIAVNPWTYTVNYYGVFDSYVEADKDNIGTFEEDEKTYLLKTESVLAYDQYALVNFSLPEEYANYSFINLKYDGKTIGKNSVTIHQDANTHTAVIDFYIKPDVSKVYVSDKFVVYDKKNASYYYEMDDTDNMFGTDEGSVIVETTNIVRIFEADEEAAAIADTTIMNAGAYKMNTYVVLEVTGKAVGESTSKTSKFLIWKHDTKELNFRVGKRNVEITSASATATVEQTKVESLKKNDPVTDITVGGDGFAQTEGADYMFSVEAFRKAVGITENAFTYELHSNTLAKNYNIVLIFGKLQVTE